MAEVGVMSLWNNVEFMGKFIEEDSGRKSDSFDRVYVPSKEEFHVKDREGEVVYRFKAWSWEFLGKENK